METLENSTAAEIAAIQATDYVQTGTKNAKFYDGSDNWVVDFEGVAKGFLYAIFPQFLPSKLTSAAPIEFRACSVLITRMRSRLTAS